MVIIMMMIKLVARQKTKIIYKIICKLPHEEYFSASLDPLEVST